MQGIHKSNGAAQTAAAWKDWRWLTDRAEGCGIFWRMRMNPPRPNSGWRNIDKCAERLRKIIREQFPNEDLTPPSARLPQEAKP